MAVSGLPEPCTSHAKDMARLALDMMDMVKQVLVDGEPVVKFYAALCKLITQLIVYFRE